MNEQKLSFSSFFSIVLKRLWIVIIFTIGAVAASGYISYQVIEPTYESKVDIVVAGKQTAESPILTSHIDDSLKLISTYQDILISPYILKDAQNRLQKDGHTISFNEKDVTVSSTQDSQVIELRVEYSNATEAALIANAIATSFDQKVQHIMSLDEKNSKVLNKGTVNKDPIFPQPMLIMGITLVLALIFSMWLTFAIHRLKDQK
ncbi:Wzz/FepE/Etk N-terminal domain-containing protein [Jeotgalibacillus sp. ET6]|uniref:YveK family protein n=1 Tax=Jeotgalibacillus sp. ET6 TaxID=3037260 RepID=UPI002418ADB6|nr:Wzz/FepE/Etk N-terminal domain-containing protein [Jeotgalibacillus sp. ET6]MDG5471707.1 Wzz/FepE/Etk N-terminal domain-containing protein [Jeotgalibacillus sp. ET6]